MRLVAIPFLLGSISSSFLTFLPTSLFSLFQSAWPKKHTHQQIDLSFM